MLRGEIAKGLDHDPNFHWRGEAVTRIENLSDIAFALGLSMLVSGSGTPQTFADLKGFLFSILPVAGGFLTLLGIWHGHFTFFRRYGVADNKVIFLNACLIFVVLYMAYPLRFAFDSLLAFILMQLGDDSMMNKLGVSKFYMSGIIIAYFGIAYAACHGLLAAMYAHAFKKRELLSLSPYEAAITKREVNARTALSLYALIIAAIAYFTPIHGIAGCLFFFTSALYAIVKRLTPAPPAVKVD